MQVQLVADIVWTLNREIFDHFEAMRQSIAMSSLPPGLTPRATFAQGEEPTITLTTDGNFQAVIFLGVDLWCSEEDPREKSPLDGLPFQRLDDFLREAVNELMTKLGILRL